MRARGLDQFPCQPGPPANETIAEGPFPIGDRRHHRPIIARDRAPPGDSRNRVYLATDVPRAHAKPLLEIDVTKWTTARLP